MRNIKTRRRLILILTGFAILAAIGIYAIVPSGVASMEIVSSSGERIEEELNIYAGSEMHLKCKAYPDVFAGRKTDYSVADENIASIDANGQLKGLKKGETLLTIQHAGARQNIRVKVQPTVRRIDGLPEEVTLYEGDGYQIEPEVIMARTDMEVPEVTYKSKRTTIATVDEDGYILAGATGTTTITVTAGAVSVKIPITVIERW